MRIKVKTQAELDSLPAEFKEYTIIEIRSTKIVVVRKVPGNSSVEARDNSKVEARDNSKVEARENSSVEAWENSSVEAFENSSAVAFENSSVVAWENSSVVAWENSSVVAFENSSAVAFENSSVVARENSSVVAWENSSVVARDNSSVVARENSSVVARENSSVEARENSSVEAWGNSSVVAWENSSVVAQGNSSVVAQGNSSVVTWGNASVEAYHFSVVFAFSFLSLKLYDWSVGRLKNEHLKPKRFGKKTTLIKDYQAKEISFDTWLERGYVVADGITSKLLERTKDGDVDVFKVVDFKKKESFVVRKGELFAHGETLLEAKADLEYKINGADTTRFKEWKRDEPRPIGEMVVAYRAITGACAKGVRDFMKRVPNLPDVVSPAQVEKMVGDAYGSQQFKDFFK